MSDLHQEKDPPSYRFFLNETPFAGLSQHWDFSIGCWRNTARLWRSCCFLSLFAAALVLVIMLLALCYPRTRVIVFQANAHGFVSRHGVLNEAYAIPASYFEAFLKRYVVARYGQASDTLVSQQNAAFVKRFSARSEYEKYVNQPSLVQDPQRGFVHVEVQKAEVLGVSEYSVFWQENEKDSATGRLKDTRFFEGTFSVGRRALQSQDELKENPLGFYVSRSVLIPLAGSQVAKEVVA